MGLSNSTHRVKVINSSDLSQDELNCEDEEDNYDFESDLSSVKPKRKTITVMLLDDELKNKKVTLKLRLPCYWSWIQLTVRLKNMPKDENYSQIQEKNIEVIEYYVDDQETGEAGRSAINIVLRDSCYDIKKNREHLQRERNLFADFLRRQPDNICKLGKFEKILY